MPTLVVSVALHPAEQMKLSMADVAHLKSVQSEVLLNTQATQSRTMAIVQQQCTDSQLSQLQHRMQIMEESLQQVGAAPMHAHLHQQPSSISGAPE